MFFGNSGRNFISGLVISASSFLILPGANATASGDKDKILDVIKTYERALNGNDVKTIVGLYSDKGVFMPSGKPTAMGQEQIKQAYEHVFKELDLDVVFHFDEIETSGDLAFVRTASDGRIKMLAKNSTITNNSRELFVMHKTGGNWKIARYMFNEAGSPHP